MIELIQFPWSPFCIVQRRILEYSGVRFKIRNVSPNDRSLVWRLTRQRYYQVPVIRDGGEALFETSEDSQVIAKYLDQKLKLGLFPNAWRGLQNILWNYIENHVEGAAFRLNDIYWQENVSAAAQLDFLRFKERKFGRGCLARWRKEQPALLEQLAEALAPFEDRLVQTRFLLDDLPRFVDFDLFGMLGCFLYSGHYELPARHSQLRAWHDRMAKIKLPPPP